MSLRQWCLDNKITGYALGKAIGAKGRTPYRWILPREHRDFREPKPATARIIVGYSQRPEFTRPLTLEEIYGNEEPAPEPAAAEAEENKGAPA